MVNLWGRQRFSAEQAVLLALCDVRTKGGRAFACGRTARDV